MQKIISLFQRNYDSDRRVRDEIVPGAEWVVAGEGVATIKWDGTCCLVRDGTLYRRYDAKHGKIPPPDFEPAQDYDPITGHMPGWIPVKDVSADKWYRIAWDRVVAQLGKPLLDGTYELCGPHFQGNSEHCDVDMFMRHGHDDDVIDHAPRDFDRLRAFFVETPIEGIVWHHPDGRMVKIKRRDFGLPWPVGKTP